MSVYTVHVCFDKDRQAADW